MSINLKMLHRIGIIPVVVLHDDQDALPLGEKLLESGLPCAEITFRTDAAEISIKKLAKAFPELYLGAGTILTAEQANRAIDAGAQFIVSPGTNPHVIDHVLKKDITMIPGVLTPTEIEAAMQFGLDTVKFFPAEPAGGIKMIKALAAPYLNLHFVPTGGIHAGNIREYLKCNRVLACGGSWIVNSILIKEKKYDEIEKLIHEAVQIVNEVRGEGVCP